ncbi:hypothetical protein B7R22_02440 [Subtercola boreus]|uniref:FAD-dependent oxidoreductase n=2 Tax=Subtercola boreus TaxID=120213 RepID=A0A3E0W3H7_9MICO|nr:FAD-dependent oxidoreductase [Subtercola boreus]RFA16746.1 hypothetical protein B7R22_02440 [Subtercola boreus]
MPRTRYAPNEVDDVPLLWSGDVVVLGGGSAGTTAAIAAAREGASTLLVESGGFLGGTGTRVLDTFYGFYAPGGNGERVVGGIGWEVCTELFARNSAFERPNTYGAGTGVTYEPEALKVVWDELTDDSGVTVLLYGLVTAVVCEGNDLVGVIVETKAGARLVSASVFVDATGEAEVAWRAGATISNTEESSRLQPATATFRVGGVAHEAASTAALHQLMSTAVAEGTYDLPRQEGSIHITTVPGIRHANMTRVSGRDLTDPWQLSKAEAEGRRQVWEYARFLKGEVDGYADSYLISSSSRIGVRETRRVVGEYVLDREDFAEARSHSDDIGRCGAPIEDHGNGATTRWEYVGAQPAPDGSTYGIPFGTLLPVSVNNLLVAGRCLSATHDAHASVRSIAQCMAMGQAAGTAAALASRSGVCVRVVDRTALREILASRDVIL